MRLSLLFFSALLLGGCGGAGGTDSVTLRTTVLRGSGGCGAPIDPCPNPVTWAPFSGVGVRVVRETDHFLLGEGIANTAGEVDLQSIPPGDWTLELFDTSSSPVAFDRQAITVPPQRNVSIVVGHYLPPP